MENIEEFLEQRAQAGLLRVLKPATSRKLGRVYFNQREYIDFSSNDYLGLADHPKLKEETKKAIDKFGTASSASRLLSGDLEMHHQLEERIACFKNKEAALVFNSGYHANCGIINSLYTKGDCIFSDRLNHASIIDGIILSGAKLFRFKHNDCEHLKGLLIKERNKFKSALIITETVFSMDGDSPPLKELVCLKEKYGCEMFVDEAHATGIFGKNGAGIVEEEGLADRVDFIMGTFSKALGGFGGYLAASRRTVEYLINTCRSFIYSTALPPAVIACNLKSIDLIKEEPARRQKLLECSKYLRDALINKGFKVPGTSQIIPLIIGDNFTAQKYAGLLQEKNYWVLPIRPPTVPRAQARLRFSLTVHHTKEILQKLIDDISQIAI